MRLTLIVLFSLLSAVNVILVFAGTNPFLGTMLGFFLPMITAMLAAPKGEKK